MVAFLDHSTPEPTTSTRHPINWQKLNRISLQKPAKRFIPGTSWITSSYEPERLSQPEPQHAARSGVEMCTGSLRRKCNTAAGCDGGPTAPGQPSNRAKASRALTFSGPPRPHAGGRPPFAAPQPVTGQRSTTNPGRHGGPLSKKQEGASCSMRRDPSTAGTNEPASHPASYHMTDSQRQEARPRPLSGLSMS